MGFFGDAEITVLAEADVSALSWVRSAAAVKITNGSGVLRYISSDRADDYELRRDLVLCGKPLMQEVVPYCPTCAALIAAVCGIENIDCPELTKARERINSGFDNIFQGIDILSPLLGLLGSGYYLIADADAYPTDGEGHFFMDMLPQKRELDCARSDYYITQLFTAEETRPAFIYPTQSAECIDRERVEYYKQILKSDPSSMPAAIGYHDYGGLNALLDGHHKALAAAELDMPVRCLLIIPMEYFRCGTDNIHYGMFGTIPVPLCSLSIPENTDFREYLRSIELPAAMPREEITDYGLTALPHAPDVSGIYPTAEELAAEEALIGTGDGLSDEMLMKWLSAPYDEENGFRLSYALTFFMRRSPEKARSLAMEIINCRCPALPVPYAFEILKKFRDTRTEQFVIDYIVSSSADDLYLDCAHSYWE